MLSLVLLKRDLCLSHLKAKSSTQHPISTAYSVSERTFITCTSIDRLRTTTSTAKSYLIMSYSIKDLTSSEFVKQAHQVQ